MFLCSHSWLSNTIEDEFGKMCPHLFAENSNRRQWGIELDRIQVVAAHHGYLFRNPNSKISECFVNALGTRVGTGKDRSRRFSACEYRFRTEITDTFLLAQSNPARRGGKPASSIARQYPLCNLANHVNLQFPTNQMSRCPIDCRWRVIS